MQPNLGRGRVYCVETGSGVSTMRVAFVNGDPTSGTSFAITRDARPSRIAF